MSTAQSPDLDALLAALELSSAATLPGSIPHLAPVDNTMAALAQGAPPLAPPDDLFDRIEAQLDDTSPPGIETIRADDGDWRFLGQGVWMKGLSRSPDGKSICLLRCGPRAVIPKHRHDHWEFALVLEGAFKVGNTVVRAGDSQFSAANTDHPELTTEAGCLLLVVA